MGLLSALAGGAMSLIGGAMDNKAASAQYQAQMQYQDPKQIRKRYEKAGFNPLLAFQGNGAGTIAPAMGQRTSTASLIGSTLDRYQDAKIAESQLELENQRLEALTKELGLKDTSSNAKDPSPTASGVGQGVKSATLSDPTRPKARPNMATTERTPVFNPAGDQIMVPKSWADRMGINNFGYLAAGEYAELVGEIRGEGETAIAMGDIAKSSGAGFFSKNGKLPDDKPKKKGITGFFSHPEELTEEEFNELIGKTK